MARCEKSGILLLIFTAFSVYPGSVKAEVKSVSACFGTSSTTCNYITLECNPGFRIRILSMKYGVKTYKCENRNNRCLKSNRNGCCVPRDDDCMEYYSNLHAYNLHRECSGKQSCGPLPVPNNILQSCNISTSTYVHVTYECQAVSDDVAVSFCREKNIVNLNGVDISVVFNSTVDVFSQPTACSCFISSDGEINIDYVDVRMIKAFTTNEGSACSTAVLRTVPDDNTDTTCDNDLNEEDNFVHALLTETDVKMIEVKLLNLYQNGNNDAPEFIWLNINAKDQNPVDVQCFKHVDGPQTTQITSTPDTTSHSTTDNALTDEDDSNTGAIVAGILVPIILLAVIGAIVAFFIWKRRGCFRKKKQPHVNPNRYTENPVIDNSVDNSEYAEIGFVPDKPETEPPYDPVYEPKNQKYAQDTCNGHSYQNVGSLHKEEDKASKKPKWPLGNIKAHTDRLISFFRNQHENDFQQVKKREKNVSDESYDHLRPTSANTEVHVKVTPPAEEVQHTYSHTIDKSVKRQVAPKPEQSVNKTNGKLSPEIKRKSGIPMEDINAVHVGDSYIEFQFGTIDKNHPNLVKAEEETGNKRPVPPSRPPPSPRSAAKLGKTQTPRSSPKQKHGVLNVQEDGRSKSPNFLTPGNAKHEESEPSYDYAAGTQVSSRNASPRGSDVSDVSSEHSYKILEEQQVYDYADVSDSEITDETFQSGSIYEDVDKDSRLVSVRKHKSAADIPQDSNEYLEPVTSRTRAISSPGVNADNGDTTNKPKTHASNTSLLKRELKERTQQTKVNQSKALKNLENKNNEKVSTTVAPTKLNVRDDSEAVKSDNVDTKDYQKVDRVKGVLKMAKLFDNKDSDSDSSRQNSPRHISTTNSPNLKKNANRTSSDA